MTINLIQENTQESIWEDNETILSVQNVSKKFCRSLKRAYIYGLKDITSQLLGKSRKSDCLRKDEFWALSNINFQLKRGESVGLIGVNGSGKTTLMRILAGILKPDNGSIKVKGRVATLTVLGAGFNPILSGRENVYINMAILGLSKQEIDKNFQNVLDFAEIWDAIDAPVRTYSSGMRARLGFACAIHTQPDILLMDEVLAVGDARFRTKCYRKLNELREKGTSFVLVSHSANAILNICNTTIYLAKGKVVMNNITELVIGKYQEDLLMIGTDAKNQGVMATASSEKVDNSEDLHITAVSFKDEQGNTLKSLVSGKPAFLCIKCQAFATLDNVIAGIIIREINGGDDCILNINSEKDKKHLEISCGEIEIQMEMPYCGLRAGIYNMKVYIHRRPFYIYDFVDNFKFEVQMPKKMNQCKFYQPRTWHIIKS